MSEDGSPTPGEAGFDFAPPPPPGGGVGPSSTAPTAASAGRYTSTLAPTAPHAASKKTRRPRKARRGTNGRWVFATMIAAIALILGGIGWAGILTYRSSGVKPAAQGDTGTLHTGQVITGMCIKEAPSPTAAPGPVQVVSCADPHHAEALVSYTFTATEWPGTPAARQEVMTFCAAQVDPSHGYVATSPGAPAYEWLAWVPSEDTWQLGDRTGVCVITTERPVAGSYGSGTAQDATADAVVS
ncbi:hypothetical protein [Demequina oxidasica]|uniref:hypothetical protein n=1 Tax=Demequina oxidasica TaxID=676199 RepID=UPI000A82074D|nr:hypothetical protein [Demequina oxidasica]